MFLRKILFLTVITGICFQLGCNEPEVVPPKVLAVLALDKAALAEAELKVVWDRRVPIDEKVDSIKQMYVVADKLYVQSTFNQLLCLDRQNGELLFARSIGSPGLPIFEPQLYGNTLLVVAGNKLYEIDSRTGLDLSVMPLPFNATTAATRNSSYIFIAASDERLHVLSPENKIEIFNIASDGDCPITSVEADEKFVSFATQGGDVVVIAPDSRKKLWSYKTDEKVTAMIVKSGSDLFVSGQDTKLYKIDAVQKEVDWQYLSGAVLVDSAKVTNDTVYQLVRGHGLAALSRQDGKLKWMLPEADSLLAQKANRAYVVGSEQKIIVIDNISAKKLHKVNLSGLFKYAVNTEDDKIYVADETGQIFCLEAMY